MKQVWILFSVANDHNQPAKAFEKLFWNKPTIEELSKLVEIKKELLDGILDGKRCSDYAGEYWLELFTN